MEVAAREGPRRADDIRRILCTIACTPFHSFFAEFLIDEGAGASTSFARALRSQVRRATVTIPFTLLKPLLPPPVDPLVFARVSHSPLELKASLARTHSDARFLNII